MVDDPFPKRLRKLAPWQRKYLLELRDKYETHFRYFSEPVDVPAVIMAPEHAAILKRYDNLIAS